jgi:putative phosphoesterase
MKIGVLSDTHLHSATDLPQDIVRAFTDVDLIVHTGDFVALAVLEGLRKIVEVKAVRGNMDSAEIRSILPEKELLFVNGKRIGVMHGSGGPWGIENRVRGQFGDVDVILYGHTHQAKNELIEGVLFFNPGEARSSYGILHIENDIRGEIVRVAY